MDPQKLSQLDPKLREAYQRVMGTPIPQPQTPSPPPMPAQNPTPYPAPEPQSIPTPPPAMPEPQPAIPPQPEPPPAGGSIPAANFDQMNSEVAATQPSPNFSAPTAQTQTAALKKKNNLMPIFIGVAALIFLVVYTLFWTKVFNFKLPF